MQLSHAGCEPRWHSQSCCCLHNVPIQLVLASTADIDHPRWCPGLDHPRQYAGVAALLPTVTCNQFSSTAISFYQDSLEKRFNDVQLSFYNCLSILTSFL